MLFFSALVSIDLLLFCSGLAFSGGGLNHFTSGLMTSIISKGLLQKHLTEAREMYKVRIYLALIFLELRSLM